MQIPADPHRPWNAGNQTGANGPAADSAMLYRAVIERLACMAVVLDQYLRIVLCSSALNDWLVAADLAALTAGQLLAEALPGLPLTFLDKLQQSLAGQAPVAGEEHFTVADRRHALRVTRIPLSVGDRRFLLVHLETVGASRSQAEEVVAQRNLEAIGQLAGGIAHDFNNLMTTVFGHIEMARIHADPNGRESLHLDRAFAAAAEAKELTSQLITFSIGGEPMTETVCLVSLLEDLCRFASRSFPVRSRLDVPPDLWPALIDRRQIDQALRNVVLNACEAMPAGGSLSISAENEHLAGGEIPGLAGGRFIRLLIRDNGCGIDDACLPRIFDPYFTTKRIGGQRGTGLGLTIAHSIIRKHGGAIRVRSVRGEGTTVSIRLPAGTGAGATAER